MSIRTVNFASPAFDAQEYASKIGISNGIDSILGSDNTSDLDRDTFEEADDELFEASLLGFSNPEDFFSADDSYGDLKSIADMYIDSGADKAKEQG